MPKTFLVRKRTCSRRLWSPVDSDTDDDILSGTFDDVTDKSGQILNGKSIPVASKRDTAEGMFILREKTLSLKTFG